MKISTKSQYGLRAMVYLTKFPQKICSLRSISKDEGISFDYLEKIISKFKKAGLIKAKRGVQGGYFLNKSPAEIKIREIIKALEGTTGLVKCMAAEKYHCPREKKCLTKIFWKKIQVSLNSIFDSSTLADLIKGSKAT